MRDYYHCRLLYSKRKEKVESHYRMSLPPLGARQNSGVHSGSLGNYSMTQSTSPMASSPLVHQHQGHRMSSSTGGPMPQVRSYVSPPSSSGAGTGSSRPQSSGLAHTVTQTRRWAQVLKDTTQAANYYNEENAIMESILSEEHSMVTNSDLGRMMKPLLVPHGPDGKPVKTAILASAKPPYRYRPGGGNSIIGGKKRTPSPSVEEGSLIERRERQLGRVSTSKVNYASMLEEQDIMERSNRVKREAYERLLHDFVQSQQRLQDRFSGMGIK